MRKNVPARQRFTPPRLILTAGPSIGKNEVTYGLDAIKNGWNWHYADYIGKFERAFGTYTDRKFAFSVTSGTAALHLAMLALGIGPGDEVIVPDQTFVSVANAVTFTGAKPVFCDIEPDTWCIDPVSFERAISKRTRAVMAVYTYGQPPRMGRINAIAKKHGIYIVEDACPAVGSLYKKKKAGSVGDIGCFSFQGAKIMVTGEGGMLVTSKKKWADRVASLKTHGRSFKKTFWHDSIGYMYRMTNLQAAIGLAQLERIEQFVAKKTTIYHWYKERLEDVEGIQLNDTNDWSKTNYWMSSLVLADGAFTISRDQLMKKLYAKRVDTRPFFFAISAFDFYARHRKVPTPVSYHTASHGMNMPSGVMLKEKEVDYIARTIRTVLTRYRKKTPYVARSFPSHVKHVFSAIKHKNPIRVPDGIVTKLPDGKPLYLYPITRAHLTDPLTITLLAAWRDKANIWFPSQFRVTKKGTKKWARDLLIDKEDRILFFITTARGLRPFGHIGLYRFNWRARSCQLDNVIRGRSKRGTDGAMTAAATALMEWARTHVGVKQFTLEVFSDNTRALKLYERIGFREVSRVPLKRVVEHGTTHWVNARKNAPKHTIERYNVLMST